MSNETKEIGVDEFFEAVNKSNNQDGSFRVGRVTIRLEGGSYAILSLSE